MPTSPDGLSPYLQSSWKFMRLYDRLFADRLKAYDLSPCERDVLLFLYNNPNHSTASDIVRYRSISKSLVSKSVERLTLLGLLLAEQDLQDRRQIRLTITEKAMPIVQDLRSVQDRYREILREGFTDEEYAALRHLLDKASHNLDRYLKGEF